MFLRAGDPSGFGNVWWQQWAGILCAVVRLIIRMAAEVLNGLMCRKISVDAVIKWLTTEHMVIS